MRAKYRKIDLTRREHQILKLTCSEKSNEFIANKLGLSKRTVEGIKNSLYKKTKAKTAIGLFKLGLKNGYCTFNY